MAVEIKPPGNAVFSEIMDDYLARLGQVWDVSHFERLGANIQGKQVMLPFFGREYRITSEGVWGPDGGEPHHAVKVILCQYLLNADPDAPEGGEWVSFQQFPDAAPFAAGFANTVERKICNTFGERSDALAAACQAYQPMDCDMELSYDLIRQLPALPMVPVLLLFNEQDGPLPASCKLLFKENAGTHLDMECLAMIGQVLAAWLCRNA
jgi:hypothetical protein